MGQLTTDRAGADHGQPGREGGQREDRLVGEVAGFREPRDGRRRGARAGADGGPCEAQRGAVDIQGVGAGEAPGADEHVHAQAGEALGRVDPAEPRPQPAHALHDGAEIALHGARKRQAELAAAADRRPRARGPDEPLDTARATFFNWMGVSYYLTESAILDNLARLGEIGGPGAEVVLDYLIAAECVPPEDRALFDAMMAFVGKRGEPMISRFDPAQVVTVLNPCGLWDVVRNESPAEHRRRYLGERTDVPPLAPITWSLHLRKSALDATGNRP